MKLSIWKENEQYFYSINNGRPTPTDINSLTMWYKEHEPFDLPWSWPKPQIADDVHVLLKLLR